MPNRVKSNIKFAIKRSIWFFLDLYLYKLIPHGLNVFSDIKKKLPRYPIKILFDVGANIGDSSVEYTKRYPSAQVVCFEPISSTFNELQTNMGKLHSVQCHQLALGTIKEEVNVILQPSSVENSLLKRAKTGTLGNTKYERVKVDTLDNFCSNHNISHIDFLKIDTEGFDLNVIKGGDTLLESHSISFIQVEAGLSPYNKFHVSFEEIKAYLEAKDYLLFGIYSQTPEWSGKPQMRFCNAVFLSSHIINSFENYK